MLVVLDAETRINNGQPSLHAAWMAGIDPRPGEAVVQVGIGSGYYTAILAELVGPAGRIDAYEIDRRLAAVARTNLAALPQVAVHAASANGRELPPADIVYVSAGVAAPEPAWLRALRPGGRLVMPWQPGPGRGRTLVVRRVAGGFSARRYGAVSFIPCSGVSRTAVDAAGVPDQDLARTRSVWLSVDRAPDASATATFGEVWFSSEQAPG